MVVLHSLLDVIDCFPEDASFSLPALKQNPIKVQFNNEDSIQPVYNGLEPTLPFADSEVFHASIIRTRRLTAVDSACKAVYEVTFDVQGSNFNFKAGDTIGVIPQNDESEVNFVISHLGLTSNAQQSYTLSVDSSVKGSKVPAHVPIRSSLRHVLTHCLDLRSVLKKLFLLALSKYTKEEKERKILEYLCSKEGSSAYTTHILNKGLCILDIFSIFTSCKPPIEVLLSNLPRLLPRPYSVVNSGLKNSNTVTICFSVMTINNRRGLTTGWLESIISIEESTLENQIEKLSLTNEGINNKIPVYLRKNMSMFNLKDVEKPIILIGPGTGVAPFIGFLEEREYIKRNNPETKLGEAWLFFGCRNPKLDFIYESELKDFSSKGVLTKLTKAFSRIDNTDIKYIQDELAKNSKEVVHLINNGAIVYVCGDLKTMAEQVREVLLNGLMEHGHMNIDEAKTKISDMQKDKQYLVDAWS